MSSFGVRLKAERIRMQLTQEEFAHLGGVQVNAQGKYESGERVPRSDYLTALNRSGVDVLYVLFGQRQLIIEEKLTQREQDVILGYRALTSCDQKAIDHIITTLSDCRRIVNRRRTGRPEYNFEVMARRVCGSNANSPGFDLRLCNQRPQ